MTKGFGPVMEMVWSEFCIEGTHKDLKEINSIDIIVTQLFLGFSTPLLILLIYISLLLEMTEWL